MVAIPGDPAWLLCCTTAVNCTIITSMYTLAPFMILEFGVTGDRQALGFWSGFVVAAFFLARAVTLPAWGRLADRAGRSAVIRSSLCLTGLGTLLCGLAQSLDLVIAARMLTGACSAVHASCCALGYQLSGNRGSAIVESGFSVGKLIGPGLAGWLLRVPRPGALASAPFVVPCGALALAQLLVVPLVPADAPRTAASEKLLAAAEPAAAASSASLDCQNRSRAVHAQALSAAVVVASVAMEECFVLYGVGELGISAPALGEVYIVAGLADLLLQNTVLLRLIQGASASELARLRRRALLLLALPLAALPFAPVSSASTRARVCLLGVLSGLRTAISYVFFVSNMSLLNGASPGCVAGAQSLRMAIGSALQVVGPPLGASAYAWSATAGHPFPLDKHFTFLCAAAWSVCMALLA